MEVVYIRIPWNKGLHTGVIPKSAFKKGRKPTKNWYKVMKGRTPWNKGKPKVMPRGEQHHSWKGGRQKTGYGYIHIIRPDHPAADKRGRIYEHRWIMEQKLGRYLDKNEVVDHINGIRDDNRPENLRLFNSNGEHLKKTRELWNKYPKYKKYK